jgi:hypothetical protein
MADAAQVAFKIEEEDFHEIPATSLVGMKR